MTLTIFLSKITCETGKGVIGFFPTIKCFLTLSGAPFMGAWFFFFAICGIIALLRACFACSWTVRIL